jgi:N-acetylglutamate synthase-like GNAT family acetyltransferase
MGRQWWCTDPCCARRSARDIRRVVICTTIAIDWFQQRDFQDAGPAEEGTILVPRWRAREFASLHARLYVKEIEAPDEASIGKPAGKRIGF